MKYDFIPEKKDLMVSPNDPQPAGRRQRGRPRDLSDSADQVTIKSLDRALTILRTLAERDQANLSALAHALGESPATVYRVLMTLAQHGIVESDEALQTWHIGPGAFLIGSAFLRRTSLVERSRPVLRALMEQTGETANLGIERDNAVLFVSQVETQAPIRAFFPPGTLSPLHASGIGKVLLASFPAERVAALLSAGLQSFTPHTLATPAALISDLAAIRTRGYAIDDQERNEGMRCIAAPIRNAHGEVIAGISVSGPTSRVRTEDVPKLAAQVIAAANGLSAALGAGP